MRDMNPEIIFVILLVGPAALGQTYFVYRYWRYSTGWRTSPVGRALMVMAVSLAILVDYLVFDEMLYYTHNDTIIAISQMGEILAYLLVSAAIWWQVITLVKTQEKPRKHD